MFNFRLIRNEIARLVIVDKQSHEITFQTHQQLRTQQNSNARAIRRLTKWGFLILRIFGLDCVLLLFVSFILFVHILSPHEMLGFGIRIAYFNRNLCRIKEKETFLLLLFGCC